MWAMNNLENTTIKIQYTKEILWTIVGKFKWIKSRRHFQNNKCNGFIGLYYFIYLPLTHAKIIHSTNEGLAPRFVGKRIVASSAKNKVSILCDARINITETRDLYYLIVS